jgi:Flp pilus assembly protein TadD
MKKTLLFAALAAGLVACSKSASTDAVTLSASATTAAVGETVTVSVAGASAKRWSVTPADNATRVSSSTTQSQYSFSAAGTYRVSANTGDTTRQHSCTQGVDSASVTIVVKDGI